PEQFTTYTEAPPVIDTPAAPAAPEVLVAPIVEEPTAAPASQPFEFQQPETTAASEVTATSTGGDQTSLPVAAISTDQEMVSESFVQQSFTTSVLEGDHFTTTSATDYTVSSTDASGTTTTDTTHNTGTIVDYADGHQVQFPQESTHQHLVEHAPEGQSFGQTNQIEGIPGSDAVGSTATITGMEDSNKSATDSAAGLYNHQAGPEFTPVAESEPTAAAPQTELRPESEQLGLAGSEAEAAPAIEGAVAYEQQYHQTSGEQAGP
ncbi:hypothetical protein BGZ80_006879, partial [Entomortierella chlamydospora]